MNRRRRLSIAGGIAAAGIAVDQLTKWWAQGALADGRVIKVLPTLELDLAYNSGFSFSTGSGYGQLIAVFVIGVCALLVLMIWRSVSTLRAVLLSTVLAGAVGNLLDRLFRADDGPLSGDVVDFVDVTWYAVFNVADSLVVCGSIAFVVFETSRHRRAEADDTDTLDHGVESADQAGHAADSKPARTSADGS